MNIHADLRSRLTAAFAPLNRKAAGSFPRLGFLSDELGNVITHAGAHAASTRVPPDLAAAFSTAAVNVWLRAVHSFLISCALTDASPIWASTAGYYSSHYAIRAFGHLLGYFQLFRRKRIVRLEFTGGTYQCRIETKGAGDREHRFYWSVVKRDPQFASDPLFTRNESDADVSDVGHRDRATYADHVKEVGTFEVLEAEKLKLRITHISRILFDIPPLPNPKRFPDLEAVQVVAYHRIVRFRQLLDEGVGVRNRFWGVHRSPSWADGFINFQLTEQGGLRGMAN